MPSRVVRLLIVLALLPVIVPARRLRAQEAAVAPAPRPWGLFSVRYDTRTSDFIYAAYGYGRSFAMVGALQNPRSGYTELLGAVGRNFSVGGGPAQTAAAGIARADGAWYAQLYFLPAVHAGGLWLRATTEAYLPLDRGGVPQLAASPLSLTLPVAARVEAGLGADVAAARGDRTSTAIGPELRLALPGATLGVDAQRGTDGRSSRMRVFFTTSF